MCYQAHLFVKGKVHSLESYSPVSQKRTETKILSEQMLPISETGNLSFPEFHLHQCPRTEQEIFIMPFYNDEKHLCNSENIQHGKVACLLPYTEPKYI